MRWKGVTGKVHWLKAFVLAGGAGTRLSALTTWIPKGMMPISGKPFIDYVSGYLAKDNVRNIIMLLSDEDSETFRNHLDDGSKFGVSIGYSISPRKGTSAAVRDAAGMIDGTFLIYYGDILTTLDLTEMLKFHREKKAACTVAFSTGVRFDYGVGKIDGEGRVQYFEEKPILKDYPVSIGVYLCEPKIFDIPPQEPDPPKKFLLQLAKKGEGANGSLTPEPHHA